MSLTAISASHPAQISECRVFFQRTDPASATERKNLFKNDMEISRDGRFDVEFGRYPVLYVDLSVRGCTFIAAVGLIIWWAR